MAFMLFCVYVVKSLQDAHHNENGQLNDRKAEGDTLWFLQNVDQISLCRFIGHGWHQTNYLDELIKLRVSTDMLVQVIPIVAVNLFMQEFAFICFKQLSFRDPEAIAALEKAVK